MQHPIKPIGKSPASRLRYNEFGKPIGLETKNLALISNKENKGNVHEAGLKLKFCGPGHISSESNEESFDSQDIQQHWKKMERLKKENAILLQ